MGAELAGQVCRTLPRLIDVNSDQQNKGLAGGV